LTRRKILALVGLVLLTSVFVLQRMSIRTENDRHPPNVSVRTIDWDDDTVFDAAGDTILSIESLSDTILVSEESRFGSSNRFTGAKLSPDGRWLAVTVAGAVHQFGWLYDLSTHGRHPVAFQYGGAVRIEAWSPDGRFAAFIEESPAPTTTIKVVDRQSLGDFVRKTSYTIHADKEGTLDPPYSYKIDRWQKPRTLCFCLDEVNYCMDAETRTIVRLE
jgi:hypothetical protein